MSEWYESLTDADIDWLKNNRIQYRMLTEKEAALLTSVPRGECEYYYTPNWVPVNNHVRWYSDTVYRLRQDWERPEPEPEWVFRDVPLECIVEPVCSEPIRENQSRPFLSTVIQCADYFGYVGTIYEWRGYRFIEDLHGIRTELTRMAIPDEWILWSVNPSVEPPRAVAVRVREKK